MASGSVETPGSLQYTVPLWIAGKEIHTRTSFDVVNPVTRKGYLGIIRRNKSRSHTGSKSVPHLAYDETLSPDLRISWKKRGGGYVQNETGAGSFWLNFNVSPSSEMLRDVAGRISSTASVITTCAQEEMHALAYKELYGVTLGIAPWRETLSLPRSGPLARASRITKRI